LVTRAVLLLNDRVDCAERWEEVAVGPLDLGRPRAMLTGV